MNNEFKRNRRSIIKTIMSLGVLSIFPFKLKAFNDIGECLTNTDLQGPFYTPNSPNISILTPPNITSNFLFITGTVYANDCITPIPNAIVDVWHANQGEFDEATNSYINSSYEDLWYRSKMYTDINGNYGYQTILPGKYLNGSYYRASHIHYKSSYLEENEVTTQLYFEGDTSLGLDSWNISDEIIALNTDLNNNLHGVFDIVLDVDPSTIQGSIGLEENRFIQAIYPNPINQNTSIYLKKQNEYFSIEICNVNGQIIEKKHNIKTHQIQLNNILTKQLEKGIYIIRIKDSKGFIDSKRFVVSSY